MRSFASVPRAGAGAEIRLSASQTVSRAGPGPVVGDGLGVGVSGDELGDGGAVLASRTCSAPPAVPHGGTASRMS